MCLRATASAAAVSSVGEGLPIQEVLPDVLSALDANNALVLQAPPGAGKTTAVPLALVLHAPAWLQGKLVLVRPPCCSASPSSADAAGNGMLRCNDAVSNVFMTSRPGCMSI